MTDSSHTEEVTSLLTAVLINRSVSDVEYLLTGLPHPDAAVDADGVTALMLAAKNANMALVELLLRHGASVSRTETARRRTAVMFAVKTGNRELVDRLVASDSELNLAAQDSDGRTALMLATQYGHCGVVENLLSHWETPSTGQCLGLVDVPNKHGQTALHEAAKRGHVAIAAALIFAGAAVDAADRWYNRPLHYAALHGHTTVVALLTSRPALDPEAAAVGTGVVRSADVDATNQGGRTALHTAAQNGHTDIAEVLLRAGASVTCQASDGDTAVLLAGRYKHAAVFDRLVAATDSTVPLFSVADRLGKTAFHYAAANGYAWTIVDVLLRYDAEMESCRHLEPGQVPGGDRRFDPDHADNMGNTALMLAVRRNNVQVVQSLLEYNCDAERQWQGPGGQSSSLLGIALRHGHADLLPLLADVGADCTADDVTQMSVELAATAASDVAVGSRLQTLTGEPRSLQRLCRRRIRRQLSCNIRREVDRLPLPARLRHYVVDV